MKRIITLIILAGCLSLTACDSVSVGVIGGADGPTRIYVDGEEEAKAYLENSSDFLERYIDESKLPILDLYIEKNYTCEDRKLVLDDSIENPIENLIYDYYYNCTSGNFEKVYEVIAEENLINAIKSDEKNFKNGIYLSEIHIDEIDMADKDELENINSNNQDNIIEILDKLQMEKFAIVEVDCTIKHNEKSMNQLPQVGNGDMTRYYLVGKTDNKYKICQVYWEGFINE